MGLVLVIRQNEATLSHSLPLIVVLSLSLLKVVMPYLLKLKPKIKIVDHQLYAGT